MRNNASNLNSTTSHNLETSSYIYLVFAVLLAITVISGNSLLILSFKSNRRLRTRTYTILVSLAFSDVLVGGLSLPLWIYGDLRNWDKVNPIINDIYVSFDVLSAVASILHLTAVSIERFIAVSKPYYFNTLSRGTYIKVIAGIWIVSFGLASLYPVQYRSNIFKRYYTTGILVVCFVLPLVIMSVVYTCIFRITRRILRSSCGTDRESRRKSTAKELRAASTLVIITGLFAFAWLPFFTLSALATFCYYVCLPKMETLLSLVSFVKWMHYGNSACNPFVYAYRDHLVKETFHRLATSCFNKFKLHRLIIDVILPKCANSTARNPANQQTSQSEPQKERFTKTTVLAL